MSSWMKLVPREEIGILFNGRYYNFDPRDPRVNGLLNGRHEGLRNDGGSFIDEVSIRMEGDVCVSATQIWADKIKILVLKSTDEMARLLGSSVLPFIFNPYQPPAATEEPPAEEPPPAPPAADEPAPTVEPESPVPGLSAEMVESLLRRFDILEVSVRLKNCLDNAGCEYFFQVVEKTGNDLLRVKNFGKKSLHELKEILEELGLQLDMNFSEEQLAALTALAKERHPDLA